ncbi:MAG: glutamine--fructose-6-phosphate transaminase (isomerizing) [Deltaproteobacteria bacterium]|nr:glutamine--fructose-6-phosphate transaminase (isomerizing) [Deltaproteobacteria bacterium]
MCGIVGYVGPGDAAEILLDGLMRLEYRGYDSSGIAVLDEGVLDLRRSVGKIGELERILDGNPMKGSIGVGHTRWATHGKPSEENAHPHRDCSGKLVVVHNGIIENFRTLREGLLDRGHVVVSETDTEIIAHLIEENYDGDLQEAVRRSLEQIKGVYALVVLYADEPDRLVIARHGPPLVIGYGSDEMFVASDIPAVLHHTRRFVFLNDGDIGTLTSTSLDLYTGQGRQVNPDPVTITWDPIMAEKGGYRHFMLKEINEQPQALSDTIIGRFFDEGNETRLDDLDLSETFIKGIDRCVILACGTSWHAGLVGQFIIEKLAGIPTRVDYGSEFRYRDPIVGKNTLAIAITQSGETADTLAAIRECRDKGATTLSICNVVGSMITRETDGVIYTHAGPEIGVASTKAFTTQLACLVLLAMYLGRRRGVMEREHAQLIMDQLMAIPGQVEQVLDQVKIVEDIAEKFYRYSNFLFLGRGVHYPIALEGALKLKEISYIHAEGYPAGEMKHGPIALIDENMPVVFLAPRDSVYEKILGNLEEVKARGGIVIAVADHNDKALLDTADHLITLPHTDPILTPILSTIPLQLFAYHVAVLRGTDVDQPRNLAKSVTVE